MDITRTIHQGTPEMRFYDTVISILREASINYTPDWVDVMKGMQNGKNEAIVAEEFIADYDVD